MYEYDFPLNAPDLDPRIAKSPLYARLFDRFAHQGDTSIDDADKKRLFKQGLLQFAAAVSKPNGGNFANSIATGLLAGSQGMNQGVDDIATRRYKQAALANDANPTSFRALDMQAQAAGFQPGTPEYQHFMRVQGGIDARQSNAAIQYKQQLGADGVMRYIAFDPNQVGAEAIGSGNTYGAPVGRQQVPAQPQQPAAPPQAPNVDAVLAQANQMVQQGVPSDQIDAWVQTRLNPPQQAPAPQAPAPDGLPPARAVPVGPSPFQSRPEEQQKALDALYTGRGANQAQREQMPYDAAQAGAVERSKVYASAQSNLDTAGQQARTAGTIEAGKQQATDAAKTFSDLQQKALVARNENNNLALMRADLQNTYTGPGANAVLGAKRVASALGVNVKGLGEAEAAQALSNKMALALRNPAGGEGMPGAMSDADRNFLQQSVPGLQSTPAGWRALINMRLALNASAIQQAKYAEQLRRSGVPVQDIPGRLQDYAEQHPIFHPKQHTPAKGALTPAEQAELHRLRAHFGK